MKKHTQESLKQWLDSLKKKSQIVLTVYKQKK